MHSAPIWQASSCRLHERPYRETLSLRDGRLVTVRPMHRSDAAGLQQLFFESLSPRARLLRFHGAVNELPDEVLREMATQIPHRRVVLAAVATTDDGLPRLLAEARYVVEPDDANRAEIAIAVADAWQGQGLGRALMQRLAAHARAEGVSSLHGGVVPGNERMLRLMGGLGATLRGHAPEVLVRLSL